MSRVLKRHCVTPSLRTRIPSTFPCSKIAFAIARHYCQRGYAPACSRFSTSAPLSWKPTPILKSRVVFTGNSIEFDLDEADKTLYDNNLGFREEVVCIGPPLLPLPGYPEIKLGREFGADGDPPFRICRKLGWDGTSSVWLAFNGFKYLAFRALTQVASVPIQDGESQLYSFVKVLDDYYLNQLPDHPGFELVLKGELYFNIQPYDQQGQLVELTGPNIGLLKATSPDRRLPLDAVKVLCRQMLMALDFLHGTCGVVHTNIKPDTIFVKHILTTEEITKLLEEDPQRMYPGPAWTLIPVEDIKNRLMFPNPLDNSSVFRPTEEFVSQPLPAPLLTDIRTLTFKLGNFENVQLLQNKMRDKLHISPNMSPPELILGLPWDEKIDIWALGCL
ncbi:unnamed protein product [Somion occarium]|uniref:non-specific serine/threonine protein kinase n=1 Tax=Somion occarium TaxID=3059160 RepID=A0ABP1DRT7_9APHY